MPSDLYCCLRCYCRVLLYSWPESVWILVDLYSFDGLPLALRSVHMHQTPTNRGFYLSSHSLICLLLSAYFPSPVRLWLYSLCLFGVNLLVTSACANLQVLPVSSSAFPSLQEPVSTPAIYEEPFADLKVNLLYFNLSSLICLNYKHANRL